MPELSFPSWPKDWVIFADWRHLGLAGLGVVLLLLLGIWWRQQTRLWFRIMTGTFLAALLLCIGSYYMFVTPPYYAGCPLVARQARLSAAACPHGHGRREPGGVSRLPAEPAHAVAAVAGASLVWRLLGVGFQWWNRSWRAKLVFILFTAVLPWAFLLRILIRRSPTRTAKTCAWR